jgi:hypothetical protein
VDARLNVFDNTVAKTFFKYIISAGEVPGGT